MLLIPTVVFGAIVLVLRWIWMNRAVKLDVPRGPKHVPIIGATKEIINNRNTTVKWVLNNCEKYEWKDWGLSTLGGPNFFAVMDEESIRFMLKDNFNDFVKGREFQINFQELLGRGIFSADGEEWRRERKIASHLFSARQLKSKMTESFLKHTAVIMNRWRNQLKDREAVEVDIQNVFSTFTFTSFCEIAFCHNVEEEPEKAKAFCDAFDRGQFLIAARFFVPEPLWKLQRMLKLGDEKNIAHDMTVINNYVHGISEARLNDPQEKREAQNDLLSLFIRHAQDKGLEDMLHVDYLREVVTNFLVAGRDTTACLLTYCIKMAVENPKHAATLLEEAETLLGPDPSREPSANDVGHSQKAPFIEAFVQETLRLHPSVPHDGKFAAKDIEFPNGLKVPKGSVVFYPAIAIGRSPLVWEDPLEFNPNRWMAAEGKPVKIHAPFPKDHTASPNEYAWPAFNSGPRICLGRAAALLETKLVLVSLLRNFNFRLLPRPQPDDYRVPVMFLKAGLPVSITPKQ